MMSRLAKVVLSSKQKGTCRIIPVMITVAVMGHLAEVISLPSGI